MPYFLTGSSLYMVKHVCWKCEQDGVHLGHDFRNGLALYHFDAEFNFDLLSDLLIPRIGTEQGRVSIRF